jgi:hypothetical protein
MSKALPPEGSGSWGGRAESAGFGGFSVEFRGREEEILSECRPVGDEIS